jgi:hypothetical protein
MTLPNFLIIGAAKSGTTALYTYLKQHPEIFMSTPKELRYFSNFSTPPEGIPHHHAVSSLEEYTAYFDAVTDEKAYGESSPMYLYTAGTAERIKTVIPDVKLLAILRNPIDRAYSAYTHALRDWIETAETFEEALEKEPERIEAGWGMLWHYAHAGLYYEQLSRYYNVFDPDQIRVFLHDDLVKDVESLLTEIFLFLDVDPNFKPDTSSRPNVSGFPKNKFLHELMKKVFINDNPIKRISRALFPETLRQKVMLSLRNPNLEKRQMPKVIRQQLQEFFAEDIQNLGRLINRDLSHWLN